MGFVKTLKSVSRKNLLSSINLNYFTIIYITEHFYPYVFILTVEFLNLSTKKKFKMNYFVKWKFGTLLLYNLKYIEDTRIYILIMKN